jgi:hypothetical protein
MPRGRPRGDRGDVLLKSAEFIGWALGGIEREILQTRERLGALTAQADRLRARLGRGRGRATGPAAAATFAEPAAAGRTRGRREMSAAARKRISEMMRKRWAKAKREGKSRL